MGGAAEYLKFYICVCVRKRHLGPRGAERGALTAGHAQCHQCWCAGTTGTVKGPRQRWTQRFPLIFIPPLLSNQFREVHCVF